MAMNTTSLILGGKTAGDTGFAKRVIMLRGRIGITIEAVESIIK